MGGWRHAATLGWVVLCAAIGARPAMADTSTPTSTTQARVIVKLRRSVVLTGEGASAASAGDAAMWRERMMKLGQRAGLTLDDAHQIGHLMHAARAHGMASKELARRLSARADVEYAVPDERRTALDVVPNDPLYPSGQSNPYPVAGQWYLRAPDATLVSAVNAPAAWAITTGSTSVVVAVIDTGVRYDHADLQGKLLPGYNMVSDAVRAGNTTGRSSDASDMGDWLTQSEINANPAIYGGSGCTPASTSSWHGTQVAGIIGANSDNGVGIASLGWGVKILPVRVLGKCGGYDSDIIAGMSWAAGIAVSSVPSNPNPAQVLNLSLGGSGTCSQAYLDAISDIVSLKHAVIVAAAGNTEGKAVTVPANCTGVIAVAALRNVGTKVGYSSVGPEVVVAAPGGNCVNTSGTCIYPIVTTTNSGTTTPVAGSAGSTYTNRSDTSLGTSFSTPMVSGAAALMLSAQPALLPSEVRQLLVNTARPFPANGGSSGIGTCAAPSSVTQDECYCTTQTCGAGMLDVGAAVTAAASPGPVATFDVSPARPQPGQLVTLTGFSSHPAPSGAGQSQFQWTLLDGGGIVSSLNVSVQGDVATATPSAAGAFKVRLTVMDDQSRTAYSDLTVLVGLSAASSTSPTTLQPSNSGGGGGAVDVASLMALLMATSGCVAVRWRQRRAAPRPRSRP
ncbi:MAG: S8 family serine peptidase [Aquabacterium sp.]